MLLCHIKPRGCESTKEVTDNIDMTNLCIVFLIYLFHSVSHPVHPLCRKSCAFFSLSPSFFPLHILSFFHSISVNRELSFQSSALSCFSQIPDKSLNVTVNVSAAGSEMEKFYTNQFWLVPSDQERNTWMRSCHVKQTLSADSGTVIANNMLFLPDKASW